MRRSIASVHCDIATLHRSFRFGEYYYFDPMPPQETNRLCLSMVVTVHVPARLGYNQTPY